MNYEALAKEIERRATAATSTAGGAANEAWVRGMRFAARVVRDEAARGGTFTDPARCHHPADSCRDLGDGNEVCDRCGTKRRRHPVAATGDLGRYVEQKIAQVEVRLGKRLADLERAQQRRDGGVVRCPRDGSALVHAPGVPGRMECRWRCCGYAIEDAGTR